MTMAETAPAHERTGEEITDGVEPTLPEKALRHLGAMLAAAYGPPLAAEADAERLHDLMVGLAAILDRADDAREVEFRAGLLGAVPALRRFAISLTHDLAAADDLLQDALLRAWRSRARFELGTNLEAWVFTILRNQFYSDRRKHREVQDEDNAKAARLAVLPEQIDRIELADVQAALGKLAAPMREALLLVTVQGMSYEDTAAVMGCALGTIKSRVARAREQLARALGHGAGEVGQDPLMLSVLEGSA